MSSIVTSEDRAYSVTLKERRCVAEKIFEKAADDFDSWEARFNNFLRHAGEASAVPHHITEPYYRTQQLMMKANSVMNDAVLKEKRWISGIRRAANGEMTPAQWIKFKELYA